jgi:hypothetical protein
MDSPGIQVAFFQHVRSLLPPHKALVDEIGELLDISTDSAYRRIRGEKLISLEEVGKIAAHYKVSLDQFMKLQSDTFLFSGKLINRGEHNFEQWTESILHQLRMINSFKKRNVYYLAKDVPLMQQFIVPELAAFKSFFWRKSILHYDEMKGQKFSVTMMKGPHIDICAKIVEEYNQFESTDIWNIESINSTIRQIEFYREANVFETENDAKQLYQAVLVLIDHLEKQAELGLKFPLHGSPLSTAPQYNLYVNDLILGDNTLLFELDGMKVTILSHSIINFISTRDPSFNDYMYDVLRNLIKKSTAISVSSEKERLRFFNRIRDKVKRAAGV